MRCEPSSVQRESAFDGVVVGDAHAPDPCHQRPVQHGLQGGLAIVRVAGMAMVIDPCRLPCLDDPATSRLAQIGLDRVQRRVQ